MIKSLNNKKHSIAMLFIVSSINMFLTTGTVAASHTINYLGLIHIINGRFWSGPSDYIAFTFGLNESLGL